MLLSFKMPQEDDSATDRVYALIFERILIVCSVRPSSMSDLKSLLVFFMDQNHGDKTFTVLLR
jgi:hypothetical protein